MRDIVSAAVKADTAANKMPVNVVRFIDVTVINLLHIHIILRTDVTPVFKKGGRDLGENYRPVSLTCVCFKILEHIITSHIRQHLDHNNILSAYQHGFRNYIHVKRNYLLQSRIFCLNVTSI